VDAQKAYASDIIIPLDELPPYHITPVRTYSLHWFASPPRRTNRSVALYSVLQARVCADRRLGEVWLRRGWRRACTCHTDGWRDRSSAI